MSGPVARPETLLAEYQDAVDNFSRLHPVYTLVRYMPGLIVGRAYRTRTRAVARLVSGVPLVWIEGHAGGIELTHVVATTREEWEALPPPPPRRPSNPSRFEDYQGVREVRWDLGMGCYLAFADDTDAEPGSEHLVLQIEPQGLTARIRTGPDFPQSGTDERRITAHELRQHIGHLQRLLFAIEDTAERANRWKDTAALPEAEADR